MKMSITRTYILNNELTANQLQDAIVERLNKLQALVTICQTEDFTDFQVESLQDYFWLQSSLVGELKEIFMVLTKHQSIEIE